MKHSLILFAIFAILLSCQRESESDGPEPAPDKMVHEAGQGIISSTFQTLSGNLSRALGEGGVLYALEFCSVEAIPLTGELAEQLDVQVRRATHKPRNPDNRADAEESRVIETYIQNVQSGADTPAVFYRREDRIHYYAPIHLGMDTCLQCHGDPGTDITDENLELIRSLYPQDEATGFSMGDVRGIWSVRMPADSVSVQGILEVLGP